MLLCCCCCCCCNDEILLADSVRELVEFCSTLESPLYRIRKVACKRHSNQIFLWNLLTDFRVLERLRSVYVCIGPLLSYDVLKCCVQKCTRVLQRPVVLRPVVYKILDGTCKIQGAVVL